MEVKKNDENPRIGVFICHCGSNIGGLIDCVGLAKYAEGLPNVVHSEDNLYTCSENGLNAIKKAIREDSLNRVVVASCTPRTHEPLFRECISEEGLNEYLFNFVNIRDQCTWVHMKQPKEAFEKAKDLVKMGVAKASKLEALDKVNVKINPAVLIIGGGIAGMSAALNLSNQGFKTFILEKEAQLGGRLRYLHKLFPHGMDASELLENIYDKIKNSPNLTIFTSSSMKDVEGFVGNYDVDIQHDGIIESITVGAIIVTVGASLFVPKNIYGYDGKIRITQQELEQKWIKKDLEAKNIVMIQCVGSRSEERVYCSSVCCPTALKNAILLKEDDPIRNVTILFRDIYSPGMAYEQIYRKARELGVIFIRYSSERPPQVEETHIEVYNEFIGETIIIPYDLLVLSTPLIANEDNKQLAQLLKVPLESNKFFLEAHVKLRPNDFATDGVFIGGAAKWPVDVTEAITQGYAAASRASTILSHDTIQVEGATSDIPEWNKNLCTGCEVCIKVCPYKAIIKNENDEIEIIRAVCKGCGVCGATCSKHAIEIKHFTDEQILSEIYAYGGKEAW
ncbi:MAG: CoB--CoM heterodisulfide reductase iron-sulfur subunit A family protein [Candidatus Lokiarchaeota archaeon]|nr:CoB--CoM heterodisulfide reductase iron-sulfur subunit A family protein [Candidatus Lokiarchaeota archaeon]